MFEKCIRCDDIGVSCLPYLTALPFAELIQWCVKRQKYLEWTNQTLADKSGVPVGTINRIKAGDYADCKYSTIKNMLNALVGVTAAELPCTTPDAGQEQERSQQLSAALKALEQAEAKNIENKAAIDYLLAQVDRLRKEVDAWHEENARKAKIIDKFLEG